MAERSVHDLDVNELLALGEGLPQPEAPDEEDYGNDSDESDSFEDVEMPDADVNTETSISQDGIVVTVEAPDIFRRKKKKKDFDPEAFIRRKLAQRAREVQLHIHKAHVVCIFAAQKFVNCHILNDPELHAFALSTVPSSSCYPGKRADLDYLEKLATWFRKKFKISSKPCAGRSLQESLECLFKDKRAESVDHLVYAFVALTRAIGLSSRLVVNFRPLPPKPIASGSSAPNLDVDSKPGPSSGSLKHDSSAEDGEEEVPSKGKSGQAEGKVLITSKKQKISAQARGPSSKTRKKSSSRSEKAEISASSRKSSKKSSTDEVKAEKESSNKSRLSRAITSSVSKGKEQSASEASTQGASSRSTRSTKNLADESEASDVEILRCEVPDKKPRIVEELEKKKSSSRRSNRMASSVKEERASSTTSKKVRSSKAESESSKTVEKAHSAKGRVVTKKSSRKTQPSKAADSAPLREGACDAQEEKPATSSRRTSERRSDYPSTSKTIAGNQRVKAEAISKHGSRKRKSCETEDDDDDDFKPEIVKVERRSSAGKSVDRRILSSDDEKSLRPGKGQNSWAEVFVEQEEKWVCVDVPTGRIYCVKEIQSKAAKPFYYIVAFNNDGSAKDVTPRYDPNWGTNSKKHRVDPDWWRDTIAPFLEPQSRRSKDEDAEFQEALVQQPLPSSIAAYKNHPLYALSRHLLKFEAIYPADAPPLGYVRGEAVYARECIQTLHSRETWLKQALVVRPGEKPYNVVKARPKYDRLSGDWIRDQPLEVFGKWQTEPYQPPVAENGIVPRNAFGNVELFKPCMLPIGCVHLRIPNLNRIARKLGVDCAPAMIGWDFHCGGSHPAYDGFVVCAEFEEMLKDANDQEAAMQAKKEEEKRLKRIYSNWRRLVRGLLIRERIKNKYLEGENSGSALDSWLDSPPPGNNLEDSSEDEAEAAQRQAAKSKENEEDLTLAAKIKKLAELEKMLGRGAAGSSRRKPRTSNAKKPAASTKKAGPAARKPKPASKGKLKSISTKVGDPFESNSSSEEEEENIEAVRESIKKGTVPRKTYTTRGSKKSYKESESEDDGDIAMSEESDEDGFA